MGFHSLCVLSIFTIGSISCLATLLATPFASRWGDVQAKHAWKIVPEHWEKLGHAAADTTINLHIALKAQDENALIDALYDVSSPGHPKYGAHLSREQVAALVAPPPDVLQLVNAWLEHHGVLPSTVSTKHGDSWLTLNDVPVSQANDLLSASYQLYRHTGTNATVLRTLSYGLPAVLHGHVQTVTPTTHFSLQRRMPSHKPLVHPGGAAGTREKVPARELGTELPSDNGGYITSSFLRWLYKTSGYVPAARGWNVLGVPGFVDQWPNPDDLRQFMKTYRSDGTSATYTVVQIKGGGYDKSKPGSEANLDIQYTSALTYPTPHVFYSSGGSSFQDDPLINWLDYVLSRAGVPQTMSISYGHEESKVPPDYVVHVCSLFARLGLRGSSVLAGSGDDGVGARNCLFIDDSGNSHVRFVPTFPSTCPWVTSVGGTTSYEPEVAASLSGGGFSLYFPRPYYQNNAVPAFLQNLGDTYDGLYNPGGRGVPDIALQALRFAFVTKGQPKSMEGTSCSTPTAAGIISLLNDFLISEGRPPLGFLNLWLYGGGLEGLTDITSGSNPGCNTDGFSAIAGWDPVTGLGSLDFGKLGEILGYRNSVPYTPLPPPP